MMSPNRRGTPPVTFRLDPELKARAMAKAAERGETLTDVLVRAVLEYVEEERCTTHESAPRPTRR